MPEHTAHEFTRLLSTSDSGKALFGCTHKRCSETEVRGRNEPSPYAQKRAAAKAAAARR